MGTTIKSVGKYFYLLIFFNFMYSCSGYKSAYLKMRDESGKRMYKNKKEFFKEYTLCSCLSQISTGESLDSKDASKSAYYDLSDDDLMIADIGAKIDSAVLAYLTSKKNTQSVTYEDRKAPILDCINYYKSKSLDSYLESLLVVLKKNKR